MTQRNMWRALLPDGAGQASGVDAANSDASTRGQPKCDFLMRPPAGWVCRVPFHHHARRKRICGLVIFRRDTGIADMWEGEGDDLASIGWICHDLLIARHSGVET